MRTLEMAYYSRVVSTARPPDAEGKMLPAYDLKRGALDRVAKDARDNNVEVISGKGS